MRCALPLNYAHISSLLSLCGRERNRRLGCAIHAALVKDVHRFLFDDDTNSRHVMVVCNALISMYARCGQLQDARKVFDGMRMRDAISWNSIISGCLVANEQERGVWYFREMLLSEAVQCDHATFTTLLSIYVERELLFGVRMVHAMVLTNGFGGQIPVGNALVSAYFKCQHPSSAQMVFGGMQHRNVITWTAMISGLAQSLLYEESLLLFRDMQHSAEANSLTHASVLLACSGLRAIEEGKQVHGLALKSGFERDLIVRSALMDLYSKCGMMEEALQMFEACTELDEISLTVILVGLAQNGFEERAFQLFAQMARVGMELDASMISAVLGAFGISAPFTLGIQIHSLAIKKAMGSNLFVSNGLINMYAKCGELQESLKIFNSMEIKNSVSWNSIIAAYARHGQGYKALELYEDMKADGAEPTDVTFLSLLHACSHVGSIKKGLEFLNLMYSDHKIIPRTDHYACVVDMLGRAGYLDEAKKFIEELPIESNAHLWQALLGACSIHGNLEMGRYAAERLVMVAPECSAAYVLLANIYSSEKRWDERARMIKKMKNMGVRKDTGASWIEIEKEVHVFVVEDRAHPQVEVIYNVLFNLLALIRHEEHVMHEKLLLSGLEI